MGKMLVLVGAWFKSFWILCQPMLLFQHLNCWEARMPHWWVFTEKVSGPLLLYPYHIKSGTCHEKNVLLMFKSGEICTKRFTISTLLLTRKDFLIECRNHRGEDKNNHSCTARSQNGYLQLQPWERDAFQSPLKRSLVKRSQKSPSPVTSM